MTDEKGNFVCPDSSQETRLFLNKPSFIYNLQEALLKALGSPIAV